MYFPLDAGTFMQYVLQPIHFNNTLNILNNLQVYLSF